MTFDLAPYRAALLDARRSFERASERLTEIEAEKVQLQEEVVLLRRTISALAALCGEPAPDMESIGITEAVWDVMSTATEAMSTNDVVIALEVRGFDLSSQKNARASVHSVLGRLSSGDKILRIVNDGIVYWKGPRYVPTTDDDVPF